MDLSEKSPLVQIGSSPIEIIRRIYNKANWVSHVDDKLQYRGFTFPDDTNESLDDLICLYTNNQFYDVCYDSELGSTEIITGDFKKTIIDNFPSDLRYLLSLNEEYYLYIFYPGQPFTVPRLWNTWSNKKEEDIPKYILQTNLKVNNSTKDTNEEKISRDIYERMFDANPNLKELIDQLNLSPTNIGEDGIDDFEDYLIRKDLPF